MRGIEGHMRGIAVVVAVLGAAVALSACGEKHAAASATQAAAARTTPGQSAPAQSAPAQSAPAGAGCTAKIPVRLLPPWARTGFSDPRPQMPFVLGAKGEIGAIVWGNPLIAPPGKDRSNKILWVSHAPLKPGGGDLRISAQRIEGGNPVGAPLARSVIGGPGPSLIDLPAGCWHLTLSWWGHTDTMNLQYSPASRT
jgi:hypothetical protein